MSERYFIDTDLREAEAMATSLVPYVHQEPLYGSVGGGGFLSLSQMPSLTIGALVMRIQRLNELSDMLTEKQRNQLQVIEARNDSVYQEWQVHYDKKMLREAHSRLDAMSTFFEECNRDPKLCARVYGPEASRRTIVQHLLFEMERRNVEDEDLMNKLRATDSRLRRYLDSDPRFIWSDTLKPAYPENIFWWLYQTPEVPSDD